MKAQRQISIRLIIICLVIVASVLMPNNRERAQATSLQSSGMWQPVTTAHTPPARYAHGMVYDSLRHVMVLFGGDSSGSSRLNDTWEYNGSDWQLINTPQKPSGRINVASGLAYDSNRGRAVLFGGLTTTGYVNDTWEYDGANWTRITPSQSPPSRDAQAMAFDSNRNVVVLFGGHRALGAAMNDTWEYNGVSWQQKTLPTTPPGRWYAPMVYDEKRGVVVLFGGRASDSSLLNDTWEYDGTNWRQVITSQSPSLRTNHMMAYNSHTGQTTLFGGVGVDNVPLADTWRFDGAAWQLVNTTQAPPPDRLDTAMAYDRQRQRFAFFGGGYWPSGQPQPTLFADTWELPESGEPSCGKSPSTGLDSCALQAGDILLVRGDGAGFLDAARFIKLASHFHHAALYVGNQEVAEAVGPFVPSPDQVLTHSITESAWWDTKSKIQDWVVLRPKLPKDKALVIQYAKDWAKADNPVIGYAFSDRRDDTSFYCSKLVWRAYDLVSYDIERPRWQAWGFTPDPLITPADLYNNLSDVVQSAQNPKDKRPAIIVISKPAQVSGMTTHLSSASTTTGPAHLMLIDPQGRRTGFDPNTGAILNEIPDAIYSGTDAVYENISVPHLNAEWQVIVTGADTSKYRLVAEFIDAVSPKQQRFEGNTVPGQVDQFTISPPDNMLYLPLIRR
jgi:uncharacterized protein YycO